MSERRIAFYECIDGYVIHDADHHLIIIYNDNEIEKVFSNKTIKEVVESI